MRKQVLIVFLIMMAPDIWAQGIQYYTIYENTQSSPVEHPEVVGGNPLWDLNPKQMFDETFQVSANVKFTLLSWIGHSTSLPTPKERYSRRKHYGSWIRGMRDGQCYNTRARVLMRDSVQPVEFRENNNCVVDSGSWYDAYSGQWVYRASELQIDHVVPVKVSYDLGGFNWSGQKRCMYFNFLAFPEHLIPIGLSENARKGARSPDLYMPLNKQFWCSYLKNWLKIKLVWGLPLLPNEAMSIQEAMRERKCLMKDFEISQKELHQYRAQIVDQSHSCNNNSMFVLSNESKEFEEDEYLEL